MMTTAPRERRQRSKPTPSAAIPGGNKSGTVRGALCPLRLGFEGALHGGRSQRQRLSVGWKSQTEISEGS